MIKAVIFDMDGVIADTEPLHKRARDRLLAALGLDVEEISPTAIGRSKRAFWGEVAAKYGLTYTADELTVKEFDALMTIVREERIRPTTSSTSCTAAASSPPSPRRRTGTMWIPCSKWRGWSINSIIPPAGTRCLRQSPRPTCI